MLLVARLIALQSLSVQELIVNLLHSPVLENMNVMLDNNCDLIVSDLIIGLTVNDNCGATLSQSPMPNTVLSSAYGMMHTVTITATDEAGNTNSSSCSVILTAIGTNTWYIDADGDNYGASEVVQCERPVNGKLLSELASGSTGTDDCNDDPNNGGADINPGAIDIPGDMIDQDCQGGDLLNLNIDGSSIICPGLPETYSLKNVRDGATFDWSKEGTGISIIDGQNTSQITVNFNGPIVNGRLIITEIVNGITARDTIDITNAPLVICAFFRVCRYRLHYHWHLNFCSGTR